MYIQKKDAAGREAEGFPGNHFLPVEENVWKKGLNALRDHGLYAALEQFASTGMMHTHRHAPAPTATLGGDAVEFPEWSQVLFTMQKMGGYARELLSWFSHCASGCGCCQACGTPICW